VRLQIDAPDRLLAEVRDDGTGAGPWQAGVGMLAMRERAAELGGTLTAGPDPDGGSVRAYFPLPAKEAS
jgi:signal transduction histidine kinase